MTRAARLRGHERLESEALHRLLAAVGRGSAALATLERRSLAQRAVPAASAYASPVGGRQRSGARPCGWVGGSGWSVGGIGRRRGWPVVRVISSP